VGGVAVGGRSEMSEDIIAILLGVVIGAVASIPASVVLWAAMRLAGRR
jgi:hypothetical protein